MTLALPLRGNRARYDITVVSNESNPSGNESKRFSRKGYSHVKNIGTKLGSIFIVLMMTGLVLLGTLSAAPSAKADTSWAPFDGLRDTLCGMAYFNAEPNDRGLGPNTADPKLMNTKDSPAKLTAYEKYGMAGMTWTVWLGPESHNQLNGNGDFLGKQLVGMAGGNDTLKDWAKPQDDKPALYPSFFNTKSTCNPIGDTFPTGVGNILLGITSWIVNISNLLFQTATETSSSVLATLSPTIINIVTKLKDALYVEFLAPVLMFGALYLGWKGLVKRSSTEAGTAALWMFGATIAGFAILANPMFLPSVVNTVVSTISETTIAAITDVSAQAGNGVTTTTSTASQLCTVDGNNGKTQTVDASGKLTAPKDFTPSQNAARTSVRQIQCTMWYSFMYTPWVIGQFGVSPTTTDSTVLTDGYKEQKTGDTNKLSDIPQDIALGSGKTPGNWALYQLDNKVNYPGSDPSAQERAMLNVAASQLYKQQDPNNTWKGASSMNRITTATLAMISALGAGAMIAIISMSMIVLQIGLVILTLLSALFLLVGVHPGFGRRIALGWLESMAGLAMKRIVLSVLLAVMLVFYSAVLSASSSVDWLISMIMVIAVSIGGISYKDQLTTMFSRIGFGGNGGISEQDLGGRHAKMAAQGAIRGAVGFAGGATAFSIGAFKGGAGARKHNKDLQEKTREEIAARRKGDDPSAGAGERPNSRPSNDESATDSSAAGAPLDETSGAGERPAGSNEIDGQGELFPEADVRPKAVPAEDPRLAGDIAAGQELVNDHRKKLNNRAGINGYRPASEEDGRRAMIAKAQEDALRENTRYNRFQKINATKEKFTSKIDSSKGHVERTVGMIGDKKRNAANAITRTVGQSAPVRTLASAREAARSYHALAKSSSPAYSKAIERHNEKKVVKQERRVENQKIKKIVSQHSDRKSVTAEAMKQAKARARSRKSNGLTNLINKSAQRL
jgi:hypothetical protein